MQELQHNANALAQSHQRCQHPDPIPPWTIHPRDLGNPAQPLGDMMTVVSQRDQAESDRLIEQGTRHVRNLLRALQNPNTASAARQIAAAQKWLNQFS